MYLLMDTHVLLWTLRRPERLPPAVMALIIDPENKVLFSAVSIWEIAIKAAVRRQQFDIDAHETFEAALGTGFVELPLVAQTAARIAALPPHHSDPFDRLLVVQAMAEPARFITADRAIAPYSELVMTFRPRPA